MLVVSVQTIFGTPKNGPCATFTHRLLSPFGSRKILSLPSRAAAVRLAVTAVAIC